MANQDCPKHEGLTARMENVEKRQDALREPNGELSRMWASLGDKVAYKIFIWIIGAVFAFILIIQAMNYREITNLNEQIKRELSIASNERAQLYIKLERMQIQLIDLMKENKR